MELFTPNKCTANSYTSAALGVVVVSCCCLADNLLLPAEVYRNWTANSCTSAVLVIAKYLVDMNRMNMQHAPEDDAPSFSDIIYVVHNKFTHSFSCSCCCFVLLLFGRQEYNQHAQRWCTSDIPSSGVQHFKFIHISIISSTCCCCCCCCFVLFGLQILITHSCGSCCCFNC